MAEEKNTQKPAKKKTGFFAGVKSESKRVTWYPTSATIKNTLWLIAVLAILGAVVGLVDLGLMKLLGLIV